MKTLKLLILLAIGPFLVLSGCNSNDKADKEEEKPTVIIK